MSYRQIAKCIPNCTPRVVGYALRASKSKIPWFRVVNSQRKISFPKDSEAYFQQKELLLKENIIFDQSDKINENYFLNNES